MGQTLVLPARTVRRSFLRLAPLVLLLLLAGCEGAPSTLEPKGQRAALILDLWWFMFPVSTVVFVVTMGALLFALFRPRPKEQAGRDGDLPPPRSANDPLAALGGTGMIVVGGLVVPGFILLALLVMTLRTTAALSAPSETPAFTVEVIGHQFWWEVRYTDHGFVTANEIHIPVGRPVELLLRTEDVIHSFWVPQLMGKLDMTPGMLNKTWIEADEPGVYWGECAEYCGIQHAKMAFLVVAEPQAEFELWLERERRPVSQPTDPLLLRGAAAFARERCIECHQIRYGQRAVGGQVGPDLTHVGSRLTIGAGILENTYGNMAGWIANPQALKPGNNMPILPIDPESLQALTAYLQSLK